MSDNVYITEERLKNYLNTNQSERERMCLQILSLDSNYSEIKPRHPNGGKDHGRDIEALYKNEILCFCGVGFVNNACDSNEQKNEIKNKFDSDLQSAIKNAEKENIKLKGFIFFTNLELTISERDSLIEKAHENGLTHCEIYHRERLLIALNSPDGFAIRFNSLNIPLSPEEQSSFFSKWGNDIQSVISNGFQEQKKAIDRMIFLQESLLPLDYFSVLVKLDGDYSSEEIGHFRVAFMISIPTPKQLDKNIDIVKFLLCLSDNSSRNKKEFDPSLVGIKNGFSGYNGFGVFDKKIKEKNKFRYYQMSTTSSIGYEHINSFYLNYSPNALLRFPPEFKITDFDTSFVMPCISENLCDKIQSIDFFANSYQIGHVTKKDMKFTDILENSFDDFPVNFSDEELKKSWKRIFLENGNSIQFDFSHFTPKRLGNY